jgi:hypothetical protein
MHRVLLCIWRRLNMLKREREVLSCGTTQNFNDSLLGSWLLLKLHEAIVLFFIILLLSSLDCFGDNPIPLVKVKLLKIAKATRKAKVY